VFPRLVGHRVNEEFFEDMLSVLPNETTCRKGSKPEHMFDTMMFQLLTSMQQRGAVEATKKKAPKKQARSAVKDDSDEDAGLLS
jgi:hypothetical protein